MSNEFPASENSTKDQPAEQPGVSNDYDELIRLGLTEEELELVKQADAIGNHMDELKRSAVRSLLYHERVGFKPEDMRSFSFKYNSLKKELDIRFKTPEFKNWVSGALENVKNLIQY